MAGDYARDRNAVTFERHQCAEQRHMVDERLRAIDGVEDPSVAAIARSLPELLAEHAVSGAFAGEELPDGQLGVAVGEGDWRAVGLQFDRGPRVVERHDDFAGDDRRTPGDFE